MAGGPPCCLDTRLVPCLFSFTTTAHPSCIPYRCCPRPCPSLPSLSCIHEHIDPRSRFLLVPIWHHPIPLSRTLYPPPSLVHVLRSPRRRLSLISLSPLSRVTRLIWYTTAPRAPLGGANICLCVCVATMTAEAVTAARRGVRRASGRFGVTRRVVVVWNVYLFRFLTSCKDIGR